MNPGGPAPAIPVTAAFWAVPPEEVEDIFMRAHLAGFQVTSRAVGDRAVEIVCFPL